MRISTSQLYTTGVASISTQQSELLHTQQQISTGRRVISPSDDPVAAAQSLEVSQANARNEQQKVNQSTADSALKQLDSQLGAVGDILQYVRERTVQAGSGVLAPADKKSLATDIRAQFDALLNLANSKDAEGEFLFSGYLGDTQPFTGNIQAGVSYQGDQGARNIQVSNSRLMQTSLSGEEVFLSSTGLAPRAGTSNTGTALAGPATQLAVSSGHQYEVKFSSNTTYSVYDITNDPGMSVPLPDGLGATVLTYASPTTISLPPAAPVETQFSISGAPVANDIFLVDTPASSDLFTTLKQLVGALEGTNGSSLSYSQVIADTLGRFDKAQDNVLSLRAKVGSQQVEIEALQNLGDDMKVQYAARIQDLVGVDYVSALSDFKLQQTYLEAAQQSFMKVTGMSLFNYLS